MVGRLVNTLRQKRKAQIEEQLRRRALNAGHASYKQQIDSAQVIRTLEARIEELEAIVYSEELA
jgi:hypothetical protein